MFAALSPREHVVGIDIGGGVVTAAQAAVGRRGRVRLLNAGWAPIEADASEQGVAEAVRKLWQTCGFSTYTVCSCLRSRSLAVRPFAYPRLSDKELESALWLEVEESLRLPRDQIALDWHVNREPRAHDGSGAGVAGILVAVPLREVKRHIALLESAGLFPVILDVGCMAIANLYLGLKGRAAAGETVCLVSLSGGLADIALLYDGNRIFPRTVVSLAGGWQTAADYLASNVIDMLKYYQFKLRRGPVTKLMLTGQIPGDGAFRERIGAAVSIPVELWDPVLDIARKPFYVMRRFKDHEQRRCAVAASLGAALRG